MGMKKPASESGADHEGRGGLQSVGGLVEWSGSDEDRLLAGPLREKPVCFLGAQ